MTPIEKLFSQAHNLPSIPRVVQDVITALQAEDFHVGKIVDQVRREQVLSARVLRLANSSAFGLRRKLGSIDEAVVLVGTSQLRSLVLASSLMTTFTSVAGLDLPQFWRRSMLTASIGRTLASYADLDPELAYTAGLTYRIGQLLINFAYPKAARQIGELGINCDGAELAAHERELLQIDHCMAGAELTRRWEFPEEISAAILHYVQPRGSAVSPYAKLLHISCYLSNAVDTDVSTEEFNAGLPRVLLEELGMDHLDWSDELENLRGLVFEAAAYL